MDDTNKIAVGTALILSLAITTLGVFVYYTYYRENATAPPVAIIEDTGGSQQAEDETVAETIPTPTSTEGRINYTSSQGISFDYPKETIGTDCSGKENSLIPINTFEDTDFHYLYLTVNCSETLQTLRDKTKQAVAAGGSYKQEKILGTWSIATKEVKNEQELSAFINEHYGTGGCYMGTKKLTGRQDGVYEVTVNGKDWKNPTDGFSSSQTCKVDYAYKILYAPAKNKVISLVLGQGCTFNRTDSLEDCYAEEDKIVNSIKFN